MKKFIRDYFTFNKRERNGAFVLLIIIFLQLLWLGVSSRFTTPEEIKDPVFEKQSAEFLASLEAVSPVEREHPEERISEPLNVPERFDFDPNTISDEDWSRLGLSEKQIRSIRLFITKGGRFRKKEDLKRMYKLSEKDYMALEPYIRIRQEVKSEAVFVPEKLTVVAPKKVSLQIELNSADSAELTQLKGIGAWFAIAIIKYRNSVGGFHSKEQLLEVWKFDAGKLAAIEKDIIIDVSSIRKININSCTAAELKNPYLSWNAVNGIVNYRKQHGVFKAVEDIRATDLVDDETYRKIVPYLVIE